jgi:hypothetical protein
MANTMIQEAKVVIVGSLTPILLAKGDPDVAVGQFERTLDVELARLISTERNRIALGLHALPSTGGIDMKIALYSAVDVVRDKA